MPDVVIANQQFDIKQVVEYSLQHNGDLKSFRDEKGMRDAGKTRAGLLPNPTIELEAGTGAMTGSSSDNNLSIGVSQEIFLAGKRDKRMTIAERELEAYRWQLADRERSLAEEVKRAFYDTMLAEQRTQLTDRSIELNRQLFEVTKARLEAGDIPELEMNLAKVELARSEATRIAVERALLQSQARLCMFMGVPSCETLVISGSRDASFSLTTSLADLKQLTFMKRPDLKALEAEKARGDADIALAEAEAIPNLTAGFYYTHEQRTDATGAGEEKVRDNLLGIRISLPLPLFDRNQAGVQEARAKRSSSESRLIAATRNAEREVEAAFLSYQNAKKVLSLYTTNIIPQLEENLKLTQEAYRLGEVGILAVIQEQKKFFEVSEGHLTAQHDHQMALVQLEAVVASELTGGVQ
jgi:cobalt-zinc-cadmium efflux system outer membrane protein